MTDQSQREDDPSERMAEKPQATQPESDAAKEGKAAPAPAASPAALENNVHGCALVIEGGAMRASYVSGLVNVLLEQGIYFDYVCGISAGATVATNYVSRDMVRTKRSFVDFAANPQMGGMKSFLDRHGFFNADYDYLGCIEDGSMPFDWQTFQANPARVRIQAFQRDTGRTVVWGRDHMQTLEELMACVRASSTMPGIMNPIEVDGHVMLDGSLGAGAGLPNHIAEDDGIEKLFVITSRPAGYRKHELSPVRRRGIIHIMKDHPYARNAMLTRPERYNEELAHLEELEKSGRALVVRPREMPVSRTTRDVKELEHAYLLGHEQGIAELPRWREFLFGE
ncbi:patatin-like phospholipase family protein [Tractidigestivibacter scatoligenes]|nr:patatin family protein [Tractidigestivibacter scatoligenes]